MNCFVIMPFGNEFDDVYVAIKDTVDSLLVARGGSCFRLDEHRPAGPITDRLLREISAAGFCVADVTGNKPNVMWELGYSMALQKPTILLTQNLPDLPFDIKDLQTIPYDRNQLKRTLREPLNAVVSATLKLSDSPQRDPLKEKDELVGKLLTEMQDFKDMLRDAVQAWNPSAKKPTPAETRGVETLQGAWVNLESGSHAYAELVNGELVGPYCYGGNEQLTGVYYGWKRTGDYWFARFAWVTNEEPQVPYISGFTFLKQQSFDIVTGAWWLDEKVQCIPSAPPDQMGMPATWKRQEIGEFPFWAREFLDRVRRVGVANLIRERSVGLTG